MVQDRILDYESPSPSLEIVSRFLEIDQTLVSDGFRRACGSLLWK